MIPNRHNLTVVRDEHGNLRIIADASFKTEAVLVLNPRDAAYLIGMLERKVAQAIIATAPHRVGLRCADCGEAGERTGHMGCQYPGRFSEGGRP